MLESHPEVLDASTHEAYINWSHKFKPLNLDFNIEEQAFYPANIQIALVITSTQELIGCHDFDLAAYANS